MDEMDTSTSTAVSPELFTKTPQELSLECAICLDLLYKPVFSPCGHVFCFWCLNSSMNIFLSSCPLCVGKYSYLPNVCESIHGIVQTLFPELYAEREIHMKREHEQSFQSPSVTVKLDTSTSREDKVRTLLSCCSCHEIAKRPMIMNCGALVCASCFNTSQKQGPKFKCPHQSCIIPLPESGPILPSAVVKELISCAFPDIYHQSDEGPSHTPGDQDESSSSTEDPIALASIPEENNSQDQVGALLTPKVHLGIGCDGCGMFPIKGDRYSCMDCPQPAGFDLCSRCFIRIKQSRTQITGRFNQNHLIDHRMKLMNPDPEMLSYLYSMMLQYQAGH